jgi:phosphatidylglycerophosphate synthase
MTAIRTTVAVRPRPWPALLAGLAGSLTVPVALVGATGPVALAGVAVYGLGAVTIGARWHRRDLGAANAVTLLRLVMVSWMAGLLVVPDVGRWQVSVAVVGLCCLLLDGVDGRVARLRGLVSTFGARFDLEVDAALVLVLSVAVVALDVAGWWVLTLGLVRYAYAGASAFWPWLSGPLFPSVTRKVVGAFVVAVLIVAVAPHSLTGLPAGLVSALLVLAAGVLCWSFGRDARWQHAHR